MKTGFTPWGDYHLAHGAIVGLIVSLSVSIGFSPVFGVGFFLYTLAGIFYGIMIEWFSTDILKAPMKAV